MPSLPTTVPIRQVPIMSAPTRRLVLLGGVLALAGAPRLAASQASARNQAAPADDKPRRRKRAATMRTPRYANGETYAQRQRREEARLKRECRGRPNAGACLGYTR